MAALSVVPPLVVSDVEAELGAVESMVVVDGAIVDYKFGEVEGLASSVRILSVSAVSADQMPIMHYSHDAAASSIRLMTRASGTKDTAAMQSLRYVDGKWVYKNDGRENEDLMRALRVLLDARKIGAYAMILGTGSADKCVVKDTALAAAVMAETGLPGRPCRDIDRVLLFPAAAVTSVISAARGTMKAACPLASTAVFRFHVPSSVSISILHFSETVFGPDAAV
jgi:hypothetical protein